MKWLHAITALVLAAPVAASAQVRTELDRTRIIGNRELPKVLYIVPWQKPQPGEFTGIPVKSVLEDLLTPVDRDVFRRLMSYDRQLHPTPASAPHSVR